MKALPLIILLIIIAIGYLYFTRSIPGLQPTLSTEQANFANSFIPYYDHNFGFSVQFPQTWLAQQTSDQLSYMRFLGPTDNLGNIENVQIFLIGTIPPKLTEADANKASDILRAQFTDFTLDGIQSNSLGFLISAKGQNLGQTYLIRDQLINCPAQSYEIIATVPSGLAAEIPAIQYMLSTFKCS